MKTKHRMRISGGAFLEFERKKERKKVSILRTNKQKDWLFFFLLLFLLL